MCPAERSLEEASKATGSTGMLDLLAAHHRTRFRLASWIGVLGDKLDW